MAIVSAYDKLADRLVAAAKRHYGRRLMSIVLFGSVGRRTPRPDSDVDLLVVARDLPRGRIRRAEDFEAVEVALEKDLARAEEAGIAPRLSPVFKTPEEALQGSPLFLDMIQDGRILYDQDGFMEKVFAALEDRLRLLGARRIWRGSAWYWDLKPDYRHGEVFDL